jgi:RNA polymerase sigma factor (sigma-70 family)
MEGAQPAAGNGRIVDPADFEAAFQQHFPPVYRFIARRVGPALAEDLAAETFATAYRRRATFDPGRASLRSWLYGIAANLVRNHWRAEQHLLALDARLVPEVDLSGSPAAVDERITAAMLAPRLAAGLAQLTRDQRDVLLLSAWAELSHEEIAAVLGIAPGTVRSRLSRARAALREHLGDFNFDLWTFDGPQPGPAREGGRGGGWVNHA